MKKKNEKQSSPDVFIILVVSALVSLLFTIALELPVARHFCQIQDQLCDLHDEVAELRQWKMSQQHQQHQQQQQEREPQVKLLEDQPLIARNMTTSDLLDRSLANLIQEVQRTQEIFSGFKERPA